MDLGLDGNVALCTAALSGLGLASATALAREGADVAVCGQTEAHLDDAREQLRAAGTGDTLAVQADITDPDHVAAFVEETVAEFGGVDHVVTSAGGPPSGPFPEQDDRDWDRAYDMLVMSAVRRTVIGLVKTVSREFAPAVRANAVLPGAHETARIENLIDRAVERGEYPDYEAGYEDWASDVPLGRVGDPEELGDVVAFLASPRASYVTGAALAVDGGSTRS